jgi:hypothetical protein
MGRHDAFHGLDEPAPGPVTMDGVANFPAYRETDSERGFISWKVVVWIVAPNLED